MERRCAADQSWELVSARPDRRLRPGVRGYRGSALMLDRPQRRIDIPTGAVSLVVNLDTPIRLATVSARPPAWSCYDSLVAGLQTSATISEHGGRIRSVEVLLAPWMAYTVLGVDLHELRDLVVPVPDILGTPGKRLVEQLCAAPCWTTRFALLDALLLRGCAEGRAPAPQVVAAWCTLARRGGAVPIPDLAGSVGCSVRRLELLFGQQIGLPPKQAARILRLQHILPSLAAGRQGSRVAADCGFYDQAHLIGEFKAMTGCTPSQFLLHRERSLRPLDRLHGQMTSALL
jgi:AraC-like DNA-binding protein